MDLDTESLALEATRVLHANDRGGYTVPTAGLYPFQWNWDSCFTALGLSHSHLDRAWREVETLFAHQWEDGMVPHMVFHEPSPGYFPGPEVWGTGRAVPTSGITQLPVAGFVVLELYRRSAGLPGLVERARALLRGLHRWHTWFFAARDPRGEGTVAILHPWESRDDSVDWDAALARVPADVPEPYVRNDTKHADPAERPTQAQYDRYLWLVQRFRALGWDPAILHDASPFRVVDPGFNAILVRSCLDTAELATALGESSIAEEQRRWAQNGLAALEDLWSDARGQYLCRDRVSGKLVDSPSIGGLLPVLAPIPEDRASRIAATIRAQAERVRYLVPSHDPRDGRFDARRYWRGPVWSVCNFLIASGLRAAGHDDLADRIARDCLKLVARSGFAEYYHPDDGAPLGGRRFSWAAAIVLELLAATAGSVRAVPSPRGVA